MRNKEGPHNQRQKHARENRGDQTPVLSRWPGEAEGRAGHVGGMVRAVGRNTPGFVPAPCGCHAEPWSHWA